MRILWKRWQQKKVVFRIRREAEQENLRSFHHPSTNWIDLWIGPSCQFIHAFVRSLDTHQLIHTHNHSLADTPHTHTHTYSPGHLETNLLTKHSHTYSSAASLIFNRERTHEITHPHTFRKCRPFLLSESHLASLASGRVRSNFEKNGISFTFSYISASWRVMHKADATPVRILLSSELFW
jgi:hypothetical protein